MLNRPIAALRRLLHVARLAGALAFGTLGPARPGGTERVFHRACELDERIGIAAWPQ